MSCSEQTTSAREQSAIETAVSTDDEIDSSELNNIATQASGVEKNKNSADVFEDGFDIETHGGGELENAHNFNISGAMIRGLSESESIPVNLEYARLPRSCDLEYPANGEPAETVCGDDDRVHMTEVSRVPWRMICQLIIVRADGRKSRCTGWFISPRTVMTAGHCVYGHSGTPGWAQSIEVIPGMDDRKRPFGSAIGTSFRSCKGWTKSRKPAHDYGCILLPESSSLGEKTGWFGFAKLSDKSMKNLLVNNSGYPGDKPFGTQWFNAGRVGKVSNKRFEYMLDSAGGQSGSPTWRSSQGKRHVVGIHAYGGCPNKSTRINSAVFSNMKKWKSIGM